MKISIGSKKLKEKPVTQKEKSVYFKDLRFRTGNFKSMDIEKIVGGGYTITYLYKDNVFDRTNSYMKTNYVGTQFICVDVDGCEVHPYDFVENIRYKPSVIHTTFSNLTERKGYRYCYHLLYFFDDIIYGEDNFHHVFRELTLDYDSYVDRNSKDCHRVIFTSNSDFENYVFMDYGVTYKVDDFICKKRSGEGYDNIEDFFSSTPTTSLNVSYNDTGIKNENKGVVPQDNTFHIEEGFLKDLYNMKRKDFIQKYHRIYPYFRETYIDPNQYKDGYVDLRGKDYYDVPTSRFQWDKVNKRPHIPRVKEGMRNKMLWIDTVCIMKIKPDIKKEHLVFLLVKEVYDHFDNKDGEINVGTIITKVKEVWNRDIDRINITPLKKSFKIDKDYWFGKGYTRKDWLKITKMIMKEMKCYDIGNLYDFSLTLEENLTLLKSYGLKITKRYLKKWLKELNQPYITDKDKRDKMVIDFHNEDDTRSSRDIERLCNDRGVKVSYRTVQNIITNYTISVYGCKDTVSLTM